jgi:hypothetical protein
VLTINNDQKKVKAVRMPATPIPRESPVLICGSDPESVCGDLAGSWPSTHRFVPGHEWSDEAVTVRCGVKESGEPTCATSIGVQLL